MEIEYQKTLAAVKCFDITSMKVDFKRLFGVLHDQSVSQSPSALTRFGTALQRTSWKQDIISEWCKNCSAMKTYPPQWSTFMS
jgi:hypothetical protein